MAGISGALQTGSNSLMVQQTAISTTGHNIANASNEDFSRQNQSPEAAPIQASGVGGGVLRGQTRRIFDRFTENKLIQEHNKAAMFDTRDDFLTKLEVVFNETETTGLRSSLNEFWNAWNLLSNQPESDGARAKVKKQGEALASQLRSMYRELDTLRHDANSEIVSSVSVVNKHAQRIKELNKIIVDTEFRGMQANDSRDERMKLLKELSEHIDLNWFEDKHHNAIVTVAGGWALIEEKTLNLLNASQKGGEVGMYHLEGVGKHSYRSNLTERLSGGRIKEILHLRDDVLVGFLQKLDKLAFSVAEHVNRLHSTGTGLNSSFETLHSSFGLNKEAQSKPIPFVKDGILQLHLVDVNNDFLETYEVEVRAGKDTIYDVVNAINTTVGDPSIMESWVEDDGSMTLQAKNGRRFIFGEDQTDFTVVMGFNNFFETLHGAKDIQLNDRVSAHTHMISTGKDLISGDNQVAIDIAKLQISPLMENGSMTFDEFYNGLLAEVGLSIQRNRGDKEHQDHLMDQLKQIRQSVSGVNIDEELATMVEYQKAYEAAAKFVTTVHQMTDAVARM